MEILIVGGGGFENLFVGENFIIGTSNLHEPAASLDE